MGKQIAKKILLIGWDAADWKVINPLLDSGKMPALERFINNGVMGNLATLNPVLSPMLWTSIATGMRPFKHGIHGFTEPDPGSGGIRPVTNSTRKVKAIWNILNQKGYKSNVIGWWPSHPAEPINGVMVSNHYQRAQAPKDKPWPMMPGTIHPPRLTKKIANLRIHPAELTAEQILPFIPNAADIDHKKDKRVEMLAKILADCSTIHACTTAVMQLEPWDFMAVYYDAIDHFGHGFMKYHPPRQKHITEKDFALYKDVVEGGYRFHDMMLGVLLKLAGEDTTVILISDHGFHPDHLRPSRIPHEPAGPAVEHRPYGIFVMKGPGIKKDETIYGASLLDLTPTMLTLFGLPVGEDMQGKPLVQAFEETPKIETIPSWEEVEEGDAGRHPPDREMDPEEALEAVKQLVALGYIEDPGEDKEKAARNTVRELRYNLAQDYIDANRHYEALPLLENLWKEWPDELRFANRLAICYQALERLTDYRSAVEEILETSGRLAKEARKKLDEFSKKIQTEEKAGTGKETEKEKKGEKKGLSDKEKREISCLQVQANPGRFYKDYMMGALLFAEGRHESALKHLVHAERAEPRLPALHIHIGHIFLKMKKWANAERAFKKALKIDIESAHAHFGLCLSYLPRRINTEAAEEALTAVGLLYHYPQAHLQLGIALHRVGYIDRAVEALLVALSQNPNSAEAHQRLAQIYRFRFNDHEKSNEHSEQAKEIRKQRKARKKAAKTEVPSKPKISFEKPKASTTHDQTDSSADIVPLQPTYVPEDNGDFITVVSGLPRSGTSMMMQMLSEGGHPCLTDEERQADDDNPRGYFELKKVKQLRKDSSWLNEAKGKAVKIIAQLLPSLPPKLNYRVVFMERNLKEILASQHKMLERNRQTGANLSDEGLRKIFEKQLRQINNMLAARKIPTIYVSYRNTIEQSQKVAFAIKSFINNGLDEQAMACVVDSNLYRQKQKTN